jgi:hypothetical protein
MKKAAKKTSHAKHSAPARSHSHSKSHHKNVLHKPISPVMTIAALGTSVAVFLFFLWVLISIRDAAVAQDMVSPYANTSYGITQ